MTKSGFITGIVTGMAVGVGASMLINPLDEKDKKKIKKNASQVFTTIGAVADHVIDMYK